MFHVIDRVLIYCFDLALNEQKVLNGDQILKKLMKLGAIFLAESLNNIIISSIKQNKQQ